MLDNSVMVDVFSSPLRKILIFLVRHGFSADYVWGGYINTADGIILICSDASDVIKNLGDIHTLTLELKEGKVWTRGTEKTFKEMQKELG